MATGHQVQQEPYPCVLGSLWSLHGSPQTVFPGAWCFSPEVTGFFHRLPPSITRKGRILAGLGVLALLIGVGLSLRRTPQSQPATIRIDGSSTVFPFTHAAIQEFSGSGKARGTTFRLSQSGTTAGFRRFCSGDTAISNASRPIEGLNRSLDQDRKPGFRG
jgi:hypothetical protein